MRSEGGLSDLPPSPLLDSFTDPTFALSSPTLQISDKDKGLAAAIKSELSKVAHAFCSQHRAANVLDNVDKASVDTFWSLNKATRSEQFNRVLGTASEPFKTYIEKTPFSEQFPLHFPVSSHGHTASSLQARSRGGLRR